MAPSPSIRRRAWPPFPGCCGRPPVPDGDEVELVFSADSDISERVIFPVTDSQSHGIEDARFVAFDDDADGKIFYATYTAYTGSAIRSELLETRDFVSFRLSPLQRHGGAEQGHGAVSPQDRRPLRDDRAAGQ